MLAQEQVPVLIVGAGGRDYPSASCYASKGLPRFSSSSVPIFRGIRARNLNFRTLEVFRGLGLEPQAIAAGSYVSRIFVRKHWPQQSKRNFRISTKQLESWTIRRSSLPNRRCGIALRVGGWRAKLEMSPEGARYS